MCESSVRIYSLAHLGQAHFRHGCSRAAYRHDSKIISNVLLEHASGTFSMKVQCVMPDEQRVKQDIESVVYCWGIYAGWHW